MRVVRIVNETRGTVLGERVEVAETALRRLVGLLGRKGLDAGTGLWIKPCSGVHTIWMQFPIDVIGLDRDLRVLKLWEALVPYRLTAVSTRIKSVVELPAGRIAECAVQAGDLLKIS